MENAELRTVNEWWQTLQEDFKRLNQNYQDYLRDFYSGKTEKLMKSVEFMVHKDKFIKYLNEFVQELQRHSKRMEQLLEKNTECMENTVLERVVASELDIPHALLEICLLYTSGTLPRIRFIKGCWTIPGTTKKNGMYMIFPGSCANMQRNMPRAARTICCAPPRS